MIDLFLMVTVTLWGLAGVLLAFSIHGGLRLTGWGIFTPDAYRGNGYGYLVNQLAHACFMTAGLVMVTGAAIIGFDYTPHKEELIAAGVCFAFGFQYLQWTKAGGGFWDSLEDAVFMAHGWCIPIFAVTLVDGGAPTLIEWGVAAVWIFAAFCQLLTGYVIREFEK